jgi:hypothetical protein
MAHANEDFVRAGVEAFIRGDLDTLQSRFFATPAWPRPLGGPGRGPPRWRPGRCRSRRAWACCLPTALGCRSRPAGTAGPATAPAGGAVRAGRLDSRPRRVPATARQRPPAVPRPRAPVRRQQHTHFATPPSSFWPRSVQVPASSPDAAFGRAGPGGDAGAPAPPPSRTPRCPPAQVTENEPHLYTNSCGGYSVFVPSLQTGTSGPSWARGSRPGTSLPLSARR